MIYTRQVTIGILSDLRLKKEYDFELDTITAPQSCITSTGVLPVSLEIAHLRRQSIAPRWDLIVLSGVARADFPQWISVSFDYCHILSSCWPIPDASLALPWQKHFALIKDYRSYCSSHCYQYLGMKRARDVVGIQRPIAGLGTVPAAIAITSASLFLNRRVFLSNIFTIMPILQCRFPRSSISNESNHPCQEIMLASSPRLWWEHSTRDPDTVGKMLWYQVWAVDRTVNRHGKKTKPALSQLTQSSWISSAVIHAAGNASFPKVLVHGASLLDSDDSSSNELDIISLWTSFHLEQAAFDMLSWFPYPQLVPNMLLRFYVCLCYH